MGWGCPSLPWVMGQHRRQVNHLAEGEGRHPPGQVTGIRKPSKQRSKHPLEQEVCGTRQKDTLPPGTRARTTLGERTEPERHEETHCLALSLNKDNMAPSG